MERTKNVKQKPTTVVDPKQEKWEKEVTTLGRQVWKAERNLTHAIFALCDKIRDGMEMKIVKAGEYDRISELTGLNKSTLAVYMSTAKKFPAKTDRVDGATMATHQIAAGLKNKQSRKAMVRRAVKNNWTNHEVRTAVAKKKAEKDSAKKEKDDSTVEDHSIKDAMQAADQAVREAKVKIQTAGKTCGFTRTKFSSDAQRKKHEQRRIEARKAFKADLYLGFQDVLLDFMNEFADDVKLQKAS